MSHAAFRTITWGVIPISVFVGGVLVEALTDNFGILNATKITMVFGTLIGTLFAAIPLARLQSMIDREKAAEVEPTPAADTELASAGDTTVRAS